MKFFVVNKNSVPVVGSAAGVKLRVEANSELEVPSKEAAESFCLDFNASVVNAMRLEIRVEEETPDLKLGGMPLGRGEAPKPPLAPTKPPEPPKKEEK